MEILAHFGAPDEITYVFLPFAVFFVVYRLVRGKIDPPDRGASQTRARGGRGA